MDKLRKAFEEVGRKGPYISLDQLGDPTYLIWSKNTSSTFDKNRVELECFPEELEIWKDLKWIN